ncbi:MAG: single-stranded DNA-binding protein, partial [Verrucomicrobiota bacterium]|nr:single-stranded DNA-binding protein [Verrucomicrobiota bacterium]
LGNLTRDPEVRYTPKGTAVADLGIAVNRTYTAENGEKREEVTFVDVTFWGRTAENAGQYLKKGRPVFVEGRLQLDSWDDKQSGQKRSKLKVVGELLQFLGGRQGGGGGEGEPDESGGGSSNYGSGSGGGGSARSSSAPPPRAPRPAEPDDDDIPF